MSKQNSEDLNVQLEQLAKQNTMLKQNQQALIADNESLRKLAEGNTKLIYKKMLDLKKDVGAIGKTQDFEMGGRVQYSFRGIDDMMNRIHPLLNKHGVGIRTKVLQNAEDYKLNEKTGKYTKNVRVLMEYIFFAEDGSEMSAQMPAEGNDTSDKATNKALSAALKYCFNQVLCIPDETIQDADFEKTENVAKETKAQTKSTTPKRRSPVSETPAKTSFRKNKLQAVGGTDDSDEL